MNMNNVMTPAHPRWAEFYNRLADRLEIPDKPLTEGRKYCDHTMATAFELLNAMGMDVAASLKYFGKHGGYCDCEILMNVEPSAS